MPLPLSPPPAFPPSLLRNKKRSVAYELRQRAVAEAKREAALRLRMVALRVSIGLFALAAILSITLIGASAKVACSFIRRTFYLRRSHAGQWVMFGLLLLLLLNFIELLDIEATKPWNHR